jgi:hypothetical protein
MLDKVAMGILQFTMQIIVGLVIGIIVLSVAGMQAIAGGTGGPQYISQNSANGGLLPPDPGFSPITAYEHGSGEYGNPIDVDPIDPNVDWGAYEQFSNNGCPLMVGGSPVTSCSQGPKGTWSHSGNGGRYAIDMAQTGIGVYAPVGGSAQNNAIQCLTTCEKLLTDKNTGNYDTNKMAQCKGYVSKYGQNVLGFLWKGDDGITYRFWHTFFSESLSYGTHYDKGKLLGVVVPGASACSTGTHVHFEVLGRQDPDNAYVVMCKLKELKCTNN